MSQQAHFISPISWMKLDKLKPGISFISLRSVYDFLLCSMLHYFVSLEDMIRRPYINKSVNIFNISYYHSTLLFLHLFSSPHFPVQDTTQLYEIYKPFLTWSPLISPLSRKHLYPTLWYSPWQQFYSLSVISWEVSTRRTVILPLPMISLCLCHCRWLSIPELTASRKSDENILDKWVNL